MLKIEELSFGYGHNLVFDNTDFQADIGQLTIIKGESGIGKTTLLDIIALKHGNVFNTFLNHSYIDESEYMNHLYYMTQEPVFCDNLTMQEQWNILMEVYGSCLKFDDYISLLGLNDVKNLYPSQLSGGEKLRAAFINILIINPQIVLMDEPTASLDDDFKTQFIQLMHILKQNCYLIVSTHDPHLFDAADVLYEINNKKIIMKESNYIESNHNLVDNKMKLKNIWFLNFLKMKRHHIFRELISLLLIAIPIAFFAYSISIDATFISSFENALTSLEDRHILVFKPLDKRFSSYLYYANIDSTCFPLSLDECKTIKKIEGVKNMTPKLILPTYQENELGGGGIFPQFKIYKNDKIIYDYQETINSLIANDNYDYSVLYIEGVEDYEIDNNNSKLFSDVNEGVFLNDMLMEKCDLKEEDIKDATIKITIGIPVYDTFGDRTFIGTVGDGSTYYAEDEIDANGIWYIPKEINVPIRGIINNDHNDFYSPNKDTFYMSREEIQKFAYSYKVDKGYTVYQKENDAGEYVETKNIDEAEFTTVYTPWEPNAYTIEIDSIENMESIVEELEKIGYAVDWKYNDYKTYGESIKATRDMINIISIVFIIFITFIFIILHFIKGQEEKKLNSWFMSIGYHDKKELLLIKSQKYLLNALIVIVLSLLLVYIINLWYFSLSSQLFEISFTVIISIIFIVLLIQLCIPMIWEVCQNVENRKSHN